MRVLFSETRVLASSAGVGGYQARKWHYLKSDG